LQSKQQLVPPLQHHQQPNGQHKARCDVPHPVVLGVLGEPNVGKSSLLNVLLGSHRVAVSSHPGRTKHLQTHYMTPQLMVCDCPGLVFPRYQVSLPMQVGRGRHLRQCTACTVDCQWGQLHK
jgi:ribosome biogenesis GTPase A